MENEGRIAELLSEALIRLDRVVDEQHNTNIKLGSLENQLAKLNLQTAENTRAIMKLADNAEKNTQFESRITNLKKAVYK